MNRRYGIWINIYRSVKRSVLRGRPGNNGAAHIYDDDDIPPSVLQSQKVAKGHGVVPVSSGFIKRHDVLPT